MKEQRPANITYPKGGVTCSKNSFVVNESLVFQINPNSLRDGKISALRVAETVSDFCN